MDSTSSMKIHIARYYNSKTDKFQYVLIQGETSKEIREKADTLDTEDFILYESYPLVFDKTDMKFF